MGERERGQRRDVADGRQPPDGAEQAVSAKPEQGGGGESIPEESLAREHEQRDFGAGYLFGALLMLLLLVVVTVAATGLVYELLQRREVGRQAPSPMAEGTVVPSEPRLESSPGELLRRQRLLERTLLESYGWVDAGAGIVRIPIERAMQVLAERGLPTRQGGPEDDR